MDHVEFTYTGGIDEETVRQRLQASTTGVLSLADGDDAYGIPLAHHYDGGDSILLRLGDHPGSEKMAFLDATDRAAYVVYHYTDPADSWSVLATGPLEPVPDAERPTDAEVNQWFPAIRVFDEAIDEVDIALYELRIERLTGRETVQR